MNWNGVKFESDRNLNKEDLLDHRVMVRRFSPQTNQMCQKMVLKICGRRIS